MNEVREGGESHAVQLTEGCCGEGSSLSRILNDAEQIVYSRPFTVAHKVHFSGLALNSVR